MMNLMSCHKFSLFQVWPIKVWKIFWKLTAELLDQTDEFLLYNEDDMEQEEVYYGFNEEERPFEISRDDDASWVLSGEKLEKLFVMTNMERDESIMKFARQLRGMGVDEALRERGAKDGDIVRIGNFEFEFVD